MQLHYVLRYTQIPRNSIERYQGMCILQLTILNKVNPFSLVLSVCRYVRACMRVSFCRGRSSPLNLLKLTLSLSHSLSSNTADRGPVRSLLDSDSRVNEEERVMLEGNCPVMPSPAKNKSSSAGRLNKQLRSPCLTRRFPAE